MARYGRLEGTGFIVLNAREHSTEEFDTLKAAQEEAAIMAGAPASGGGGSGMAIVYAPVCVMRPNVPTNVRMAPGGLMKQIQDANGPIPPSASLPVSRPPIADTASTSGSDYTPDGPYTHTVDPPSV